MNASYPHITTGASGNPFKIPVSTPASGKAEKIVLAFILSTVWCCICLANNLRINNVTLASTDPFSGTSLISFDISWENSWRDALNYDAVWIFVKYRLSGTGDAWEHATLSAFGHEVPAGGTGEVPLDGMGMFLYRSADGAGDFSLSNIRLNWNHGADGLMDGVNIDIRVLGIEMVYVPTGSFWLGDGEATEVYGNFEADTSGLPFQITGEEAVTLGGGSPTSLGNNNKEGMWCCGGGHLNGTADDFDDTVPQTLPESFPKGYHAFYCMKYEVSQQAWVTFLNMITFTQAVTHASPYNFYGSPYTYYRYGVDGNHPNYTTSQPYLPIVYVDWIRGAAYADWAGLRPMTELEFEKACRGTAYPLAGEYVWGTDQVDLSDDFTLFHQGAADEGIATGYDTSGTAGNLWIGDGAQTVESVTRVGAFAAHPFNNGRVTAGATLWGIMDMGGSGWELCVTVGYPQGRMFAGTHGNGELNADGYADVATWPGNFGGGYIDTNFGMGRRGGGIGYPPVNTHHNTRISSRILATEFWPICSWRDAMRFVRTAPP